MDNNSIAILIFHVNNNNIFKNGTGGELFFINPNVREIMVYKFCRVNIVVLFHGLIGRNEYKKCECQQCRYYWKYLFKKNVDIGN